MKDQFKANLLQVVSKPEDTRAALTRAKGEIKALALQIIFEEQSIRSRKASIQEMEGTFCAEG